MILVVGEARFAPGEIERIRETLESTVRETRKEPGCEMYSYAVDLSDPDLLRISERWADRAALDAHFTTPHMATLSQALGAAKLESISVKAWRAEFDRVLVGK